MSVSSTLNSDGSVMNISVAGRFDFSQHQAFRAATEQAGSRIQSFVVDLSRSDYMDSAALGMLLLLLDKVGGDRQRVRIVNPSAEVRKILEIANFHKLFSVE